MTIRLLGIPTPVLLAKVVDMIDQVPMDARDTKGDLYEYKYRAFRGEL